jgi:hypothetical protein
VTTYTGIKKSATVSVTANTPVKLFDPPARGRSGYRVRNPSDTLELLIIEVQKGSPAPVAADFAEDVDFSVGTNKTQESGASDNIDVYGLMSAAGTVSITRREMFARRDIAG